MVSNQRRKRNCRLQGASSCRAMEGGGGGADDDEEESESDKG